MFVRLKSSRTPPGNAYLLFIVVLMLVAAVLQLISFFNVCRPVTGHQCKMLYNSSQAADTHQMHDAEVLCATPGA